jgi:hypothetical protein
LRLGERPKKTSRQAAKTPRMRGFHSEGDLIAIGKAVLPNLYHPSVVL